MQVACGSERDWAIQIRRFRRQHRLNQVSLAERLGVDQATVSRWESGRALPGFAIRHRLRDLIHRVEPGDALLRHWIESTTHSVLLSSDSQIILAASAAYEAYHGLAPRSSRGMSTKPTLTDEARQIRDTVVGHGFFRGDVASVTVVSRGNQLGGLRRGIPMKGVWVSARVDGGRRLMRAERVELSEAQYVQALAENGGPLRIVTMDDLVSPAG